MSALKAWAVVTLLAQPLGVVGLLLSRLGLCICRRLLAAIAALPAYDLVHHLSEALGHGARQGGYDLQSLKQKRAVGRGRVGVHKGQDRGAMVGQCPQGCKWPTGPFIGHATLRRYLLGLAEP